MEGEQAKGWSKPCMGRNGVGFGEIEGGAALRDMWLDGVAISRGLMVHVPCV